jgi:transposase
VSLTELQRAQIVELVGDGIKQGAIAEDYGISQQMVSKLFRAGAKKGRHGGDRKGKRYRKNRAKRARKIVVPTMPF